MGKIERVITDINPQPVDVKDQVDKAAQELMQTEDAVEWAEESDSDKHEAARTIDQTWKSKLFSQLILHRILAQEPRSRRGAGDFAKNRRDT